jgi:hypothetical protein
MYLRRARVVGRSFAVGAQPLTHVCINSSLSSSSAHLCTVRARGKNNSAWASGGPPGKGVRRRAGGDGANCPSGQHGAKYRNLKRHLGFKSFSKISNFRGLGCSRKRVAHHQSPPPPPEPTMSRSA